MTQEFKNKIENIIEYCRIQADIYNNYQMSSKILINSIYGSLGFAAFYFYNKDLAEAITKQGKNVILYAEDLINKWTQKVWQKDIKTHKLMGIKIKPECEKLTLCKSTRYIDTDSIYTSFEEIVNTTDWFEHDVWRLTKIDKKTDLKSFTYVSMGGYPTEDDAKEYFKVDEIDTDKYDYHIDTIEPAGREFCLTLDRVFMHDFLKKIHKDYADRNGTEALLDFELEAYNEAGIWLAKKKYIKNTTWTEPNVYYDSCTKIKATGVEIAQTSSSPWVKKQLTDLVTWIFKEENFVFDNFVAEVRKVKDRFMRQNVDIVSVSKGMNRYENYTLNDTTEIELQPKAMVTIQGAALYNWMLNNNEKYKRKYSVLMNSDKLCVVYIKPNKRYTYWKVENQVKVNDYFRNPENYKLISNRKSTTQVGGKTVEVYTDIMSLSYCEAFSYPAGQYPLDMAGDLEIDMNRMFDLLILGPINRIVEAMGYQPLDINMTITESLW